MHLWVMDQWVWVTHMTDPSRIWVEVANKRIPMGMDPGHP